MKMKKIIEDVLSDDGDNSIKLPSAFQPNQAVGLTFMNEKLQATILGVHFYPGKVKYDAEIIVTHDGLTTRIYNVDSVFFSKV